MINSAMLGSIAVNAAQALGLLSIAGVMAGMIRWRRAARRDLLLSVIVFLFGTGIAQIPIQLSGASNWPPEMVYFSALGRLVQVLGAVLFIRASLRGEWPDWGWKFVVLAIALMTWIV